MKTIVLTATALVVALAVVLVSAAWWMGRPSKEALENFRAFESSELGSQPFLLSALRPGNWKFACVGGEYLVHFDHIARPYAETRGYLAESADDFHGDIVEISPWAIAMFDADGKHFTWHMNERLLRYRTQEDLAHGWCFEATEPFRLATDSNSTPFLDIPGREAVEAAMASETFR
jgi:hypothetical protein